MMEYKKEDKPNKIINFYVGQSVKLKDDDNEWIVLQTLENNQYRIGREGVIKDIEGKELTLI